MWLNAYSAKNIYGSDGSTIPNIKVVDNITNEEKDVLVRSSLEAAGKMLLFTYNMLSLDDKMDAMLKEQTSGDEFILLFRKVNPENIEVINKIVFTK